MIKEPQDGTRGVIGGEPQQPVLGFVAFDEHASVAALRIWGELSASLPLTHSRQKFLNRAGDSSV
jgi:hypothetical protein